MWKRLGSGIAILAMLCTLASCSSGGDEWEEVQETQIIRRTYTNAAGEVVTEANGQAATIIEDPNETEGPQGTTATGANGEIITSPNQPGVTATTTTKAGATTSAGAKKIVNLWMINQGKDIQKVLSEATKTFNSTNGQNIQGQISYKPAGGSSGYTGFDDLLVPAIAAKKGPDIIVTGTTYYNEYVQMDDYLKKYQDSDFKMDMAYPVMRESGRIDGKLYGLPFSATYGRFLLYNKTMFKKAGLDPTKPPKTIKELDEYAAKMTTEGSGNKYATIGFCPWEWYMSTFSQQYYVFGGEMSAKNGTPTPNLPANVKALEWVQSYVNKYGYDKMNNSMTAISPGGSPFQSGKLGMQMVYSGHISGGANWSFEWGVADFPGVSGTIDGAAGSDIMVVFKTSKNPEAAFRYVKALCGLRTQTNLMKYANALPTFSPLQAANEANYDVFNPTLRAILKTMVPNVKPVPFTSATVKAPANYDTWCNEVYTKVLTKGGNPAALLKELEQKVKVAMGK